MIDQPVNMKLKSDEKPVFQRARKAPLALQAQGERVTSLPQGMIYASPIFQERIE